MCEPGFREAQLKHIELPEENPDIFGHFLYYLYRGDCSPDFGFAESHEAYVVVAENLAQGTTVRDLESTMLPTHGIMATCTIWYRGPTVVARMAFTNKTGAENIVRDYNNLPVRQPFLKYERFAGD